MRGELLTISVAWCIATCVAQCSYPSSPPERRAVSSSIAVKALLSNIYTDTDTAEIWIQEVYKGWWNNHIINLVFCTLDIQNGIVKVLVLKIYLRQDFGLQCQKLELWLGQNWARNSKDIANMAKCCQDIRCLDKYHHNSWHLLSIVPEAYLWSKSPVTAEIFPMLLRQMSLWQLDSVLDFPRNLCLKFGQNRVSNSWDIWWGLFFLFFFLWQG